MDVIIKIAEQSDHINFEKLSELINSVYLASEAQLWVENHRRISTENLIKIFESNELFIAKHQNKVVGCIHLEKVNNDLYKFKMVAVDFHFKRKGIGGRLVSFAEQQAIKYGAETMQLELLVPEHIDHPDKVILENWYTNIGYVQHSIQPVDFCHSGLGQFLKTPCKAVVYQKPLVLQK